MATVDGFDDQGLQGIKFVLDSLHFHEDFIEGGRQLQPGGTVIDLNVLTVRLVLNFAHAGLHIGLPFFVFIVLFRTAACLFSIPPADVDLPSHREDGADDGDNGDDVSGGHLNPLVAEKDQGVFQS